MISHGTARKAKLTLTQRFESNNLFVFLPRTLKVGSLGPKTFRNFRETDPGLHKAGLLSRGEFKPGTTSLYEEEM